ncbi:hypothetical protein KPSA3_00953 [Pseudomonas syringae pv. actinidiae]|uniref:Uncharacterized protein n=1 Tax=Pseudomonas syringae pv. actinidiae TaxID=103796 RepID=A0AAN4Q3D8_PSESF|nr:hypothetical protein KPSA3_00953 [Pseudomonas syringae pv. actinidiae]
MRFCLSGSTGLPKHYVNIRLCQVRSSASASSVLPSMSSQCWHRCASRPPTCLWITPARSNGLG